MFRIFADKEEKKNGHQDNWPRIDFYLPNSQSSDLIHYFQPPSTPLGHACELLADRPDLRPVTNTDPAKAGVSDAPMYITAFVKSAGISKSSRQKKLSNPRINQIVHLFYTYNIVVTTNKTRTQRLNELHSLINVRLKENGNYFSKNQLLKSTYEFFQKLDSILK